MRLWELETRERMYAALVRHAKEVLESGRPVQFHAYPVFDGVTATVTVHVQPGGHDEQALVTLTLKDPVRKIEEALCRILGVESPRFMIDL